MQVLRTSWGPLRDLVKALGSPCLHPNRLGTPREALGGPTPTKQGEGGSHLTDVFRLRVWLGSAQCALELYGVVFEHIAVLLGTEAPPLPAFPDLGGPKGPLGPPGNAEEAVSPLLVVLLLPRLIRAVFGWLTLMSEAVSGTPSQTLGGHGGSTTPSGGPPLLTEEVLQRLRRLAWRSAQEALMGAFRYLNNCALPGFIQQQQQQQQEAAAAAAWCCCCCSTNAARRIRRRTIHRCSKLSNSSSSAYLINLLGGPSGCVLSRACLLALGITLVQWGPFIHVGAVTDLLLRIHSIFPRQDILLQFLEALASAAAAGSGAVHAAAAEGRCLDSPLLLSRALHAPVPYGLLVALKETIDVISS